MIDKAATGLFRRHALPFLSTFRSTSNPSRTTWPQPVSVTQNGEFSRQALSARPLPRRRSLAANLDITLLDRHHAPLVLLIWRQLRIWLVHPTHDRVVIGIDRQHRVALDDLAGGVVDSGIPQPGQRPRLPVDTPRAPPDVLPVSQHGSSNDSAGMIQRCPLRQAMKPDQFRQIIANAWMNGWLGSWQTWTVWLEISELQARRFRRLNCATQDVPACRCHEAQVCRRS